MRKSDGIFSVILTILFIVVLGFLLSLLFTCVGIWLWELIMVNVFGLPTLTFWQFFGLMILLHILFPGMSLQTKKEN